LTPSIRYPLALATGTAVALFALLAVGCGGSSSAGVASIGTSTNASATKPSWAATYHCFAAHGYPKYRIINSPSVPSAPPISGWYKKGNNFVVTPAFQKLYSGAKFEAAEKACMPLVPYKPPPPAVVAARVAQARRFAQCARAHGMPNIPDPGSEGAAANPWLIDLKAAGINYEGPKFKDILATCQSTLKDGLLPFIVGNGG
jgi:hypothetical protein